MHDDNTTKVGASVPEKTKVAGGYQTTTATSKECSPIFSRSVNGSNIPQELRELPRWVVWRAEWRPGKDKPTKVPYCATTINSKASSTDPATWTTFEQAMAAFEEDDSDYEGVGFVLNGDGVAGVDLDGCIHDGVPDPRALALLDALDARYVEVSPSGKGLRAFGYAQALQSGTSGLYDGIKTELYTSGRYLTLTGNTLRSGPLAELRGLSEMAQSMRGAKSGIDQSTGEIVGATTVVDDATVRDLRSALNHLPADDRGDWVAVGHALKELGNMGRGLWLDWSQKSDKYQPEDARTWDTFKATQTGYKAVFARAQAAGWVNPAKTVKERQEPDEDGDYPDDVEGDSGLPFGSEQELADTFSNQAIGHFKWSPGLEWMANKGTHWERDELLTRYTLAKSVCKRAANGLDNAKVAAKICAASTSNAMINLARSAQHMATPVRAWDAHPMLLNTPGEVLDLETGQTVPRDGLLFTQVAGVAPTKMRTPVWDKFISEVFDGDLEMIEFIQRMGGYCLTGSIREQKLFFLHGGGANGKSVLLDVLRNIGGKYSHNLPSEALMTSRNEGHPTMFASLHGKRLAISSEIEESAHWAESRIKSLTGDETLTARYMRQDFFTFAISHKHVIAGNFKPRLKGDDFAMVRRMVLIPFMRKFEGANRDDNLPHKLRAEYPGILTWFADGARKWGEGGLAIPASVSEASREYMSEHNDVDLWIAECCKKAPGLTCPSSTLYASFSAWKERNGEHAASSKAFSQRLDRTYTKKRTKDGMVFEGLSVNPFGHGEYNAYEAASRGE